MERLELRVKGMHCEGCERGVVAALQFLPGIAEVEASAQTGTVRIAYDATRVTPQAISNEIAALEYEVNPQ